LTGPCDTQCKFHEESFEPLSRITVDSSLQDSLDFEAVGMLKRFIGVVL
jgi:hypothetical protein